MTVAELIEVLKSLPPDTPLARSCGGDCIGYMELRRPHQMTLYPNPDHDKTYVGDLYDESDFQAHKRCEAMRFDNYDDEAAITEAIEKIHKTTYPLPDGKTFLVF
jgi:hypothetical protein